MQLLYYVLIIFINSVLQMKDRVINNSNNNNNNRYIFEKFPSIKFHENLFTGRRVVPRGRTDRQTDRQTDRHDEANSCFSQFCERA